MKKEFKNECTDCGHIGSKALWKVEGYVGLVHVDMKFPVGPELGPNPIHFDLDTIDANVIMDKYKISAEKAEELILNGEPCCPDCQSTNFFTL